MRWVVFVFLFVAFGCSPSPEPPPANPGADQGSIDDMASPPADEGNVGDDGMASDLGRFEDAAGELDQGFADAGQPQDDMESSQEDMGPPDLVVMLTVPMLEDAPAQRYTKYEKIAPLVFSNIGGGELTDCTAEGLPPGLEVFVSDDLSTCELRGMPVSVERTMTATIVASNTEGTDDARVEIVVAEPGFERCFGTFSSADIDVTMLEDNRCVLRTKRGVQRNFNGQVGWASDYEAVIYFSSGLDPAFVEATFQPDCSSASFTGVTTETLNASSGGVCGDGNAQPRYGEVCDDGDAARCMGTCSRTCLQELTGCGDGVVCGVEECDDAGESEFCNSDCTLKPCGNGIADAGETCDDGNRTNGDGCRADCKGQEVCGDGLLDVNEECDDGNVTHGDGCDASCLVEAPCRCSIAGSPCTTMFNTFKPHVMYWDRRVYSFGTYGSQQLDLTQQGYGLGVSGPSVFFRTVDTATGTYLIESEDFTRIENGVRITYDEKLLGWDVMGPREGDLVNDTMNPSYHWIVSFEGHVSNNPSFLVDYLSFKNVGTNEYLCGSMSDMTQLSMSSTPCTWQVSGIRPNATCAP